MVSSISVITPKNPTMSAGLFHQPPAQLEPWHFASDALRRLRMLLCRVVPPALRPCRSSASSRAADRAGTDAVFGAARAMLAGTRPCTMLMFQLGDLPELECVFGTRAAREALAGMEGRLARLAGRNGFAARTAPTLFTVVLPIGTPENALAAARVVFGRTCCLELQVGGDEIMLVPDLAVHAIESADEVASAHDMLCRRLAAVQQRPQPRARPRRPAAAVARPPVSRRHEAFAAPIPATIPLPLGLR